MLCAKNMEAGVWSTCLSACFFFFSSFRLTRSCLSLSLGSCLGFTVRLMALTFAARNFFALPMAATRFTGAAAGVTRCKQCRLCFQSAGGSAGGAADATRLASAGVALHTDSKLCFSRPGGC